MNSEQINPQFQQFIEANLQLPHTFADVVAIVKDFALEELERHVIQKQLYYHTHAHVKGVQHRANLIFEVIRPYWEASLQNDAASEEIARMQLLLDICAIAHDSIQIFVPQTQPHTSRRRETGVSEAATIQILFDFIKTLNQHLSKHNLDHSLLFTDTDLAIIQEAIAATVCVYDPTDRAIYQPVLYNSNQPISPVTRSVALADIGALGIEGIAFYQQEGGLLFLEENPDIIPLILDQKLHTLAADNPELYENLRQRLLRRACFQVNFAKSRLNRLPQELAGFPTEVIPVLTQEVFQYLNQETVQEIESITPTAQETPLEALVEFFQLEQFMNNSEFGIRDYSSVPFS